MFLLRVGADPFKESAFALSPFALALQFEQSSHLKRLQAVLMMDLQAVKHANHGNFRLSYLPQVRPTQIIPFTLSSEFFLGRSAIISRSL